MATERILLPGRDETVDYIAEPDKALRSLLIDFDQAEMPLTPLREIAMLRFMDEVTEKPNWHRNIYNPDTVAEWRKEASDNDLTEKMIDWCIDELRHNASLVPADTGDWPPVFVFHGDVYKSDTALPVQFKKTLQEAITKYEDAIPLNLKVYRPGSNGMIWDLVDPSLFPLVYGRTRVLKIGDPVTTLADCIERSGEGAVIEFPGKGRVKRQDYAEELPFSKNFQWLPCEVDISGDDPIITSYVNDLHPSEKPLYGLLETMVKSSVLLWDLTLAPAFRKPYDFVFRVSYNIHDNVKWINENGDEDEDELEYEDEERDDSDQSILPEPKLPFSPLQAGNKLSLKDQYGRIQVIVKFTNVELSLARFICDDNHWHVETPLNEHIVATSLYCYSCSKNIKMPTVSFRHIFTKEDVVIDRSERPTHHDWLSAIFGVEEDAQAVQDLGAIAFPEGRLLTFPNTLQYSMDTVELEDTRKPGHMKFVVLYLVDPNIKIISTAHVPCQRHDWAGGAASQFDISAQDANMLRKELLNEREDFEGEFESKIDMIIDL